MSAPKKAAKNPTPPDEAEKKQFKTATPLERDDIIMRLAAIESAVERDEELQKIRKEFGWSITSLREDVDKTRKRVLADAAKERKESGGDEDAVRTVLTLSAEEAVAYFNARYAVIRAGSKVRILVEDEDVEGRQTFELLTEKDFKTETANKGVVSLNDDDETHMSANDFWLKSPDRREYSGLVFRPGEVMTVEPGANWRYPKFYNMWRGWGVEPSEKGSCEKYKRHLLDNVCKGREDYYDWLWSFIAHIFQKPMEKPDVAIGLRGPPGVGKTKVGEVIGKLVGPSHYVAVAQKEHLVGKFNKHIASSLFTQADEAVWTRDPSTVGVLKDLITCKRRALEAKTLDVTMVDAFDRLLLTSNEDSMIPAEPGERRYFALDVSDAHAEDTAYFAAIDAELKDGGYERLLWELLHTDLSGFDCRTCPKTEELAFQKERNLSREAKWMLDALRDGKWWSADGSDQTPANGATAGDLFEPKKGADSEFEARYIRKETVYNDYGESCRAQGRAQYKLSEMELSKLLIECLGFRPSRKRTSAGERIRVFALPWLKDARAKFLAKFELRSDVFDDDAPDLGVESEKLRGRDAAA
jgi:hypothetical protein